MMHLRFFAVVVILIELLTGQTKVGHFDQAHCHRREGYCERPNRPAEPVLIIGTL